jgi:hypothetical protein
MIKINLKKFNFSLKKLGKGLVDFWVKSHDAVFYITFLGVSALGFYFFYIFVYKSDWNEIQKKEYSLTQEKNTDFKENQFIRLVELTEGKKKNLNSDWKSIRDIFQPYK